MPAEASSVQIVQYITATDFAQGIRKGPKGSEHRCEHRNNVKRKNSMIFNTA